MTSLQVLRCWSARELSFAGRVKVVKCFVSLKTMESVSCRTSYGSSHIVPSTAVFISEVGRQGCSLGNGRCEWVKRNVCTLPVR